MSDAEWPAEVKAMLRRVADQLGQIDRLRARNAELAGALQYWLDESHGTPPSAIGMRHAADMAREALAEYKLTD